MCEDCEDTGKIEDLCSECNGSGEGMYDGSVCRNCKGSGVELFDCDCDIND